MSERESGTQRGATRAWWVLPSVCVLAFVLLLGAVLGLALARGWLDDDARVQRLSAQRFETADGALSIGVSDDWQRTESSGELVLSYRGDTAAAPLLSVVPATAAPGGPVTRNTFCRPTGAPDEGTYELLPEEVLGGRTSRLCRYRPTSGSGLTLMRLALASTPSGQDRSYVLWTYGPATAEPLMREQLDASFASVQWLSVPTAGDTPVVTVTMP